MKIKIALVIMMGLIFVKPCCGERIAWSLEQKTAFADLIVKASVKNIKTVFYCDPGSADALTTKAREKTGELVIKEIYKGKVLSDDGKAWIRHIESYGVKPQTARLEENTDYILFLNRANVLPVVTLYEPVNPFDGIIVYNQKDRLLILNYFGRAK